MKGFGYAVLAFLLAVLAFSLLSDLFTQAPSLHESTIPSRTNSLAMPQEPIVDPATADASPRPEALTNRESGPDVPPVEPVNAAGPSRDDPARAGTEVDLRNDRRNEVLGSLIFIIRDYRELPVSGVQISLRSESGEEMAFTGAIGEAVFDGLAAGRYAYQLESSGRPELSAEPLSLGEGEERILELWLDDYDRSITGRILDQAGDPVGGLNVTARPYHGQADVDAMVPNEQLGVSGLDGRFEITGLGEGEYELNSLATDRHTAARAIVRAGADGAVLSVSEVGELQVVGQVTDAVGKPLAGVGVSELWGQRRQADTDETGRYSLSIEDAGSDRPRSFRFELDGYRPEQLALGPALADGGNLRLDASLEPIEQPIEVSVHIRDERGRPIEGEMVHLYSRRLNSHYRGTSGTEGDVLLPEVLPSSDYRLSVLPKSPYRTFMWPLLDLRVEPPPLEIVLQSLSTGRLWGRMVDMAGQSVPHFSMWLHSDEAQGRWIRVTGDSFGYFDLEDVPEGRLTLQTRSRPLFRTSGIELAAGSEVYVEAVLDWGDQLVEGQVIDESGGPLAGAQIQLDWHGDWWMVDDHYSSRQTLADSAGAFQFSELGGGSYQLRASAAGYATRQIGVQFGDRVQVQLQASEE